MSQHIGDLKNAGVYDFYHQSVQDFLRLFRVEPRYVVCDMHPDYRSTRYSRNFVTQYNRVGAGKRNGYARLMQVQHHHAHVASCMAEHGLNGQVIGIALDGTGYGDDGKIWGGEFLVCDRKAYQRYAHLQYTPMPGGDKAVEEPWRMAVSYLYQAFGNALYNLELDFIAGKAPEDIKLITSMIRKEINSPLTSSAGRLFDAVSAILGICTHARYEAEAAMLLESTAEEGVEGSYGFDLIPEGISMVSAIRELVDDLQEGQPRPVIAAKFHNTVGRMILSVSREVREHQGLNRVVLSGGTFQNKYLSEITARYLKGDGFEVYQHRLVPANDGGIALGQLAIASAIINS